MLKQCKSSIVLMIACVCFSIQIYAGSCEYCKNEQCKDGDSCLRSSLLMQAVRDSFSYNGDSASLGELTSVPILCPEGSSLVYSTQHLLPFTQHRMTIVVLNDVSFLGGMFTENMRAKEKWEKLVSEANGWGRGTPGWIKAWERAGQYALSEVCQDHHQYINLAVALIRLGLFEQAIAVLQAAQNDRRSSGDAGFLNAVATWWRRANNPEQYE